VKRYDGLRRILSITNADSRTKRYEYDGVNLTRESDWKGQFTEYRYDRINRLTEIIDRLGQLTSIAYNDTNGLAKEGLQDCVVRRGTLYLPDSL
jgi:YD repeat-containing protein